MLKGRSLSLAIMLQSSYRKYFEIFTGSMLSSAPESSGGFIIYCHNCVGLYPAIIATIRS